MIFSDRNVEKLVWLHNNEHVGFECENKASARTFEFAYSNDLITHGKILSKIEQSTTNKKS